MKYLKAFFYMLMLGSLSTKALPLTLGNDDPDTPLDLKQLIGSKKRQTSPFEPIQAFINQAYLQVNIIFDEKVNIKIEDSNGMPVYMRQYKSIDDYKQMRIDITGWDNGNYTVKFETLNRLYKSTCSFSK